MLLWGIVATLLGVAQNYGGFLAARFFLGVTESGLFPGVVFYLSMWYRRTESHYRVALFFSAASLAGAFGGILAYGIGFMKGVGGYAGWRWIFILVCYSQVTLCWPSGGHCRGGRPSLHY
jgi:MFS family permease